MPSHRHTPTHDTPTSVRTDHVSPARQTTPKAEWTLLIYMNAKADLADAAIMDFREMATVGSTPDVNVIVQLGKKRIRGNEWAGVRRFRVEKDAGENDAPLEELPASADMISESALADFLAWGRRTFPAERYAVILWSHGRGWSLASKKAAVAGDPTAQVRGMRGYRAAKKDDESEPVLYNSMIERACASAFGATKVDVIGFDSCLMAMLETAYALRQRASYMVASEEWVLDSGWDYAAVLSDLVAMPDVDGSELAKRLVAAYARSYAHTPQATLSAVNLTRSDEVVERLHALTAEIEKRAGDRKAARDARAGVLAYGPLPSRCTVDLRLWSDNLLAAPTSSDETRAAATMLNDTLTSVTVANFRSDDRDDAHRFGSNGCAIYFPANAVEFFADTDHDDYVRSNPARPLTFVQETSWPDFLLNVFEIPVE